MRHVNDGFSVCLAACLIGAGIAQAAVPAGWTDKCFGSDTAGYTSYTVVGAETNITVNGEGLDIWGKTDTGRFVFMPIAGDCELLATLPAIPQDALYSEWARQGLMFRGALLNNAVNIMFCRDKGLAAQGNRVEGALRATHDADTVRWGSFSYFPFATNTPARLRFVRQGDTYLAWASTNAPAYDQWVFIASQTQAFYPALNAGLFVSRHTVQAGGPTSLTCEFGNVILRSLVTAVPGAAGIAVSWIGDAPVTNGTVVGYAVSRAVAAVGSYSALATTDAATRAYADATAGVGTSYVYRVYAQVQVDAVTNSLLVGTSLPSRRPVVTANPSPSGLNGVTTEYTASTSGALVGARVDPNINDSWNYSGSAVYPAGTPSGLSGLDNFRTAYNGNLTVTETGCYGLIDKADDIFNLWVDGAQVMAQTWWMNGLEINTAPVWLEAGRSYPIRANHTEFGGGEIAVVRWFKGESAVETIPQARFEPFPTPWQHRDVGDSPRFGNAAFAEGSQTFTVASGGAGIDPSTGRDDGHLVWQTCSADFDLIARVASLQGPAQAGVGAGLAVRRSMADNAAAVSLLVVSAGAGGADRELALAFRSADGGVPAVTTVPLAETPASLRLSRRGTSLACFYSTASTGGWVAFTNLATSLTGSLAAGLTAFSGDVTQTATGVFDTVSFVYPQGGAIAVAVASHQATVSVPERPPMEARQGTNGLSNIAYYWSDALSGAADSYAVYRSSRPDASFSVAGDATRASGFAFTEAIAALNTLVFYKWVVGYDLGALAAGGTDYLTVTSKVYGVSDGSVTGTGAGLYAAFHRAPLPDNYYTNRPMHNMIRDLSGWEKGAANTPMVAAAQSDDGVQIGPDNFQCTWAGWLVPPYTGYYWFRTQTDDAIEVWVAGSKLISYIGYTGNALTSSPVWLEAGTRVPIHVYFQQGGGGGYFRMWWMTGYGLDAGYVTIPSSQLAATIPDGTPYTVAPGSSAEFGPWRNIDIATGKPGYASFGGTPTAFDCALSGGGSDIWGTADQFHYVYQEIADNFEIEATFNSLLPADAWSKVGLMVRDGTAANARNLAMITSASNGYRLQLRDTAGGGSNSLAPSEVPGSGTSAAATPVTFKLVRERGKIKAYVNGTHVTYIGGIDIDVSGWSKTLCVGLAITSHNNGRLAYSLATDVSFKVVYPKGSVVILE
jgi:hypothetical protein